MSQSDRIDNALDTFTGDQYIIQTTKFSVYSMMHIKRINMIVVATPFQQLQNYNQM